MNRNKRLALYLDLIASNGGETSISGKYRDAHLTVVDEHKPRGLVLFAAAGWRQYSSSFGARRASLAYLCGNDDNGRWAVRVPGSCETIAAALDAITPAEVMRARKAGKHVLRQGDVFVIANGRDNFAALDGTRHRWDAETRILRHLDPDHPHEALHVPFPAKAIMQTVLRMGRLRNGRRTRFGD